MASELTEAHRNQQLALRAAVIRELLRIWPALRWEDLDETFPLWSRVATAIIDRNRRASSALAGDYYRALRFAEGATGPVAIVAADPLPREQVNTVLRVTGLISARAAAARGVAAQPAMQNAFVTSSGAISRLVLNAGRETITATSNTDRASRGWRRITSGRACSFCSTLASQGAVYRGSTATFQAHDHCGCTAEPAFR